jgi:hypothetical protein
VGDVTLAESQMNDIVAAILSLANPHLEDYTTERFGRMRALVSQIRLDEPVPHKAERAPADKTAQLA